MPTRMLHFCPSCLLTHHTAVRELCHGCGTVLRPLLDDQGALSGEFLAARGSCCDTGCRNCPYPGGHPTRKICQRCEAAFECQPKGCWCEGVRLSATMLESLKRSFDDCLCPACLTEMSIA